MEGRKENGSRTTLTITCPNDNEIRSDVVTILREVTVLSVCKLNKIIDSFQAGEVIKLTQKDCYQHNMLDIFDRVIELGVDVKLIAEKYEYPKLYVKDDVVVDMPGTEYDALNGLIVEVNSEINNYKIYIYSDDKARIIDFSREQLRSLEVIPVEFKIFDLVKITHIDDVYENDFGVVVKVEGNFVDVCVIPEDADYQIDTYHTNYVQLKG